MFEIFLIAIGLSVDAASVAVGLGLEEKRGLMIKNSLLTAIFFGGFQALMPLIGWWGGSIFKDLIMNYDHWVAFVLLFFIGFRMIVSSLFGKEKSKKKKKVSLKKLLLLAVATSIDALAVGISFSFLKIDISKSVAIIGMTTFVLSFLGYVFGKKIGRHFEKQAKTFGGVILILIGLKILLEHLF